MSKRKIAFLDRDGTMIIEPEDKQIDSLEKLEFIPNVIPALLQLQRMGFELVMVSNQNGIGSPSFPTEDFEIPHTKLLQLFASQGIEFVDVLVCPHFPEDNCDCRKPKLGLVRHYIQQDQYDKASSIMVGDRRTDLEFAQDLGITGFMLDDQTTWSDIIEALENHSRRGVCRRKTRETEIVVEVDLEASGPVRIQTGIGFFDHMLEQIGQHAAIGLTVHAQGDLEVDEHHTVEDTAIALGRALGQALGDKHGLARYGFLLPMDESLAEVALDLSGRGHFEFSAEFKRESVGGLPCELVGHFFKSLAENIPATLHLRVCGENAHHQIEALFKGFARALRQAINKIDDRCPSTKGAL